MAERIDGPVGKRYRKQNVTNNSRDQAKVIGLLAAIPESKGGKKESWEEVPPLAGADGSCAGWLVDAIWNFQVFWKANGVLRVVDGVVDRDKSTLRAMNELVEGMAAPAPEAPTAAITPVLQDMVVLIKGFDPRDDDAGKKTEGGKGEPGVPIPDAADFQATLKADPKYLQTHLEPIVEYWNGGGGRAKPSSDPSDAVVKSIKAAQAQAVKGGNTFSKVILWGYSIGGRNAATVARRLVSDGVPLTYLGVTDAAFDDKDDKERTAGGIQATSAADNFFESLTNDLPGQEFHGPIPGCNDQPFDNYHRYKDKRKKFDNGDYGHSWDSSQKKQKLFFDDIHAQAVKDGVAMIMAKIKGVLRGE
jgi:hypothetical protein